MPIYEYHCEPCDEAFETLVRSSNDIAHCPKCGNIEVKKQFSVPASAHTGSASSASLPVCETGPSTFGCGGGKCMTGMCGPD